MIIQVAKENSLVVQDWLIENVGEYYGRGERAVVAVGSGWEMMFNVYTSEDVVLELVLSVDIDDQAKATFFALKWGIHGQEKH